MDDGFEPSGISIPSSFAHGCTRSMFLAIASPQQILYEPARA